MDCVAIEEALGGYAFDYVPDGVQVYAEYSGGLGPDKVNALENAGVEFSHVDVHTDGQVDVVFKEVH